MKKKDMHLPAWVLILGIFLAVVACGILSLIFFVDSVKPIIFVVIAVICAGLGAAAIICWKNQWVEIVNDFEFLYSTMFGKKTLYRFSDITGMKYNQDSMTLMLGKKKVHIESCAVISDRFAELINKNLKKFELSK